MSRTLELPALEDLAEPLHRSRPTRLQQLIVVALAATALLATRGPLIKLGSGGRPVSVIVRIDEARAAPQIERAVSQAGGHITHRFHTVDGFAAVVPEDFINWLAHIAGVESVT